MDFEKLFHDFTQLKVAVIGDVMLDTYWWGNVDRISPEAPVPVVAVSKREHRIGGAGNVALNIASLGASVSMISVLGKDDDPALLPRELDGLAAGLLGQVLHEVKANPPGKAVDAGVRLAAGTSGDVAHLSQQLLLVELRECCGHRRGFLGLRSLLRGGVFLVGLFVIVIAARRLVQKR